MVPDVVISLVQGVNYDDPDVPDCLFAGMCTRSIQTISSHELPLPVGKGGVRRMPGG